MSGRECNGIGPATAFFKSVGNDYLAFSERRELSRPGYSGEFRVWVRQRWPDRIADDSTLRRTLRAARDRWARAVGDCSTSPRI